jgi:hypothetical protein
MLLMKKTDLILNILPFAEENVENFSSSQTYIQTAQGKNIFLHDQNQFHETYFFDFYCF